MLKLVLETVRYATLVHGSAGSALWSLHLGKVLCRETSGMEGVRLAAVHSMLDIIEELHSSNV
jgi:hypothetical protein